MKLCKMCNTQKDLSEFKPDRRLKTGYGSRCKKCEVARTKAWRQANKAKDKQTRDVWNKANPDKLAAKCKRYRARNPGLHSRILMAWHQANPHKNREYHLSRDTAISKAIPLWYDEDEVSLIYRACRAKSKRTGIQHDVDHIVPLRGKGVCGLHCSANLQILTHSENCKKGITHG